MSNLELILLKLKLKELEIIDRISSYHNGYVIRCINDFDTNVLIAIDGD